MHQLLVMHGCTDAQMHGCMKKLERGYLSNQTDYLVYYIWLSESTMYMRTVYAITLPVVSSFSIVFELYYIVSIVRWSLMCQNDYPTHCLLLFLIVLNHLFLLHLSYCLLWNSFIKFTLWWPQFLQHEKELQLSHILPPPVLHYKYCQLDFNVSKQLSQTLPPPPPHSPQSSLSHSFILLFPLKFIYKIYSFMASIFTTWELTATLSLLLPFLLLILLLFLLQNYCNILALSIKYDKIDRF